MRIETAQWLSPAFVDTYISWCKKQGRETDIIDVPAPGLPDHDDAKRTVKCFWLGDKAKAKYMMVYTHGGGFVFAGSAQHLNMLDRWVKWSQGKLAILCVCYSLSPGAVYPIAVGETVEALRWVLSPSGGNRSPGQVLLGGDSAGGNLAIAVLSHLSGHPHPNTKLVKSLDLKGESLKGVILVAPWVSADEKKYPSVSRLKHRDIIGPGCATYWSKAYMGAEDEDEYMWAALANVSWWNDVKAEKILVLAGEEEMLIDAIQAFAIKLDKGTWGAVTFRVGEKETHAQPLMVMDEKRVIELGERCQEGAIKAWIESHLVK